MSEMHLVRLMENENHNWDILLSLGGKRVDIKGEAEMIAQEAHFEKRSAFDPSRAFFEQLPGYKVARTREIMKEDSTRNRVRRS